MELLKALSELPGAPGRESRVRDHILAAVKDHVDSWSIDTLGNLLCHKKSSRPDAKRVMLACHMDEIAFMVRYIDDEGFLRVQQLGGFDTRNLFARRVRIETRDGKEIVGNMNPASRPVHVSTPEERRKIPLVAEFYIDTGLPPEEVKKRVRIGDPVTLIQDFVKLGGHLVSGKSMDNRIACWLGVRALQDVQDPAYDLHVAFTVQEEIGIRGAAPATYAIEPDISIALDVTLALDTPGSVPDGMITKLGQGVAIKIMDAGTLSDPSLVDEFVDLATAKEIPHQFEVLPFGATDNAAQQRSRLGSRAICLSVPTRHVHTVTETVHTGDLHAARALLKAYLSA